MPIYEFKCPVCGDKTDKMQKYSDPAPACINGCVDAGGDFVAMDRQMSVGSFELKGTGWYQTDFKGK